MDTRHLAFVVFLAGVAPAQDRAAVQELTGRVVDPKGSPIPGAAVSLVDLLRLQTSKVLANPTTRSDKDGRFRVSPGKGVLYIAAKDRRARVPRLHDPSKGRELGVIVLYPGVTLTGTVVDGRGKRLAGVQVTANERRSPSGRRFTAWTGVMSGARTNERGIFQLPCAAPSAVELKVSAPGYATASRFPVGAGSPLHVVLHKTGFVSGRVVDDKGRPRETRIYVGYEAGESQRARSNADGTFRLPVLHRGRYRLSASGWGLRWKSEILAGPRKEVVIQPTAKRGADGLITTAIRVEDAASGDPIRSFRAWFDWEYTKTFVNHLVSEPGAEVKPDAKGVLHLPVPEVRKKRRGAVFIVARGHAAKSASIADAVDGGELVIQLDRERVLAGQVVSASTGDPVAGVRVWAVRHSGGHSQGGAPPRHATTTDAKGAFRIGQVGTGMHALQAYHPDWGLPKALGFNVDDSDPGKFVIRMPQTRALSATLEQLPPGIGYRLRLQKQRVPVQGYSYDPPGGPVWAAVPRSGSVKITGLSPGTYTAELTRPAAVAGGSEIRSKLGTCKIGDGDVVAKWDAAGFVTGRLEGRLSIPVPTPQILVEAYAGTSRIPVASSTVDPGGRFEFELKPGSYQLRILDLASGLVLGKSDVLDVDAGKLKKQDLTASAGRVLVQLVPRSPNVPRPAVSHLVLKSDSGAKAEMRVPHESHRLQLYAPPGRITIQAVSRDHGRISTYGGAKPVELGAGEVQVRKGARVELKIPLRGPPTLDEIEGRR